MEQEIQNFEEELSAYHLSKMQTHIAYVSIYPLSDTNQKLLPDGACNDDQAAEWL